MTYVHPSAARTVAVYPKLPLFQALRMRQEEQCPATTTECGRLRTGAHKRMERINQKEKKQQQQTLSSLMFIDVHCLESTLPEPSHGNHRRTSTKAQHQRRCPASAQKAATTATASILLWLGTSRTSNPRIGRRTHPNASTHRTWSLHNKEINNGF